MLDDTALDNDLDSTTDGDTLTEEIDDFEDVAAPRETRNAATYAYRSPLLARVETTGQLTMDQLRQDVPAYQAGQAAQEQLNDPDSDLNDAQRRDLQTLLRVGQDAQERLTLAGIPLVKSLAMREYRRRQGWKSTIGFEDLFMSAMAGYLRGLLKYDVSKDLKSPTNYVGQWCITQMRRDAEPLDNDFELAHETAETFRRIRALRGRLTLELGRAPTDQEMVDASTDAVPGGMHMGKASRQGKHAKLTLDVLEAERTYSTRVGTTGRLGAENNDDDDDLAARSFESASPVTGAVNDAPDSVVEAHIETGMARLLQETMTALQMGADQQEIIARRWAIDPYVAEHSIRDIGKAMNINMNAVQAVIEAFQAELVRPQGTFHLLLTKMDPDDVVEIGLTWAVQTLGTYTGPPATADDPAVLTHPMTRKASAPLAPRAAMVEGVYASFECSFHRRPFRYRFQDRADVPDSYPCPACTSPSRLIIVQD